MSIAIQIIVIQLYIDVFIRIYHFYKYDKFCITTIINLGIVI